jgi:hypothetical protein
MTAIAIATLLTGLVTMVLCLPLINRQVPRNDLYGIRIAAAFESDQRWYDINAYGGRLMAKWSSLIVAAGICGFFLPQGHVSTYATASLLVTLLAILVPVIKVYLWSRKP